jgi:dihydrofolate synthase/folylpolyglutamate synthase
MNINGIRFRYKNEIFDISMIAEYQIENAILAIETIRKLYLDGEINISENQIKLGIKKSKWAGRFEIIKKNPLIIIDGAHNLDGIKALKKSIKNLFADKKILGVFSMLGDKNVNESVKEIMNCFDKVIVTDINNVRVIDKDELFNLVKLNNENVEYIKLDEIIKNVELYAKDFDATIVFGSLYMIGDFRKSILL